VLFWVFTQPVVVIPYQRFGKIYRSRHYSLRNNP